MSGAKLVNTFGWHDQEVVEAGLPDKRLARRLRCVLDLMSAPPGQPVPAAHRPVELRIQGLDRIRGVNNPAYRRAERKERYYLVPMSAPSLRNGRIFPAPWTHLKGLQGGQASFGIFSPVDAAKRARDHPSVVPRSKAHGITDQIHNAGLDDGLSCNWKKQQNMAPGAA